MEGMPPACAPYVHDARRKAGTQIALLAGALLATLLALVLVLLLLPRGGRRVTLVLSTPVAPTHTLAPQPHVPSPALRLAAPSPASHGREWLAVPVAYSKVDEGFVARVRLGMDNVLVVLDSGSANLSVGTADCVKAALCSAHDGAYRPGASPHAINLQAGAHLAYASLTVQAAWWHDALALPFVADGCRDAPPPPLERVAAELVVPSHVRVAAAARMDGTTSNILGLMGDYHGAAADTGDRPILEVLLAALGLPRRWSLAAGADGGGWLVLGAPPPRCPRGVGDLHWLPMVPRTEYAYMGAPIVRVARMRVMTRVLHPLLQQQQQQQQQWRTLRAAPRYLVLDTGTAESYLTAPFAATLYQDAALPSGAVPSLAALPDLELVLGGGVTLRYTPQQYMVPVEGGAWRSTFHANDPKVAALFGDDAVMLLGIHHLMGLALDVDLGGGRVGLAPFTAPSGHKRALV